MFSLIKWIFKKYYRKLKLISVTYFTLVERKILGAIQRRRGPNLILVLKRKLNFIFYYKKSLFKAFVFLLINLTIMLIDVLVAIFSWLIFEFILAWNEFIEVLNILALKIFKKSEKYKNKFLIFISCNELQDIAIKILNYFYLFIKETLKIFIVFFVFSLMNIIIIETRYFEFILIRIYDQYNIIFAIIYFIYIILYFLNVFYFFLLDFWQKNKSLSIYKAIIIFILFISFILIIYSCFIANYDYTNYDSIILKYCFGDNILYMEEEILWIIDGPYMDIKYFAHS